MQQKPLKLKINIHESWRSEFHIYHSKSMHLYTVHILHVCVFTFKNIEGLSQYSFHSEIYCMYDRLHCIRNEQNSLHIKYHQKLNVNVNFPFSCMILPIVIKCSLTAQNVFTCRHIPVLYTVAIVKIFFLLLV